MTTRTWSNGAPIADAALVIEPIPPEGGWPEWAEKIIVAKLKEAGVEPFDAVMLATEILDELAAQLAPF